MANSIERGGGVEREYIKMTLKPQRTIISASSTFSFCIFNAIGGDVGPMMSRILDGRRTPVWHEAFFLLYNNDNNNNNNNLKQFLFLLIGGRTPVDDEVVIF